MCPDMKHLIFLNEGSLLQLDSMFFTPSPNLLIR